MAFSTQKDFLHVAYLNEHPESRCLRMEGVKLRTYAGTFDERAWSMNKDRQAQYLIDLVSCRMYTSDGDDYDRSEMEPLGSSHSRKQLSLDPSILQDTGSHHPASEAPSSERKPCSGSIRPDSSAASSHPECQSIHNVDGEICGGTPLVGGDSVIVAALDEMSRLEALIAEKDNLKNQLELSKERLRVLSEERDTINAVLRDSRAPEISADFQRKIDDLRCQSKIDKNDENELQKLHDRLVEREKAYQVLDAQNGYLRRLVDKMSSGGGFGHGAGVGGAGAGRDGGEAGQGCCANVDIEPETSEDVDYLQCVVDCLRRQILEMKTTPASGGMGGGASVEKVSRGTATAGDKDAENIARIIAERNALREKVHNFAAIEGKIVQWKRDSEQFQCMKAEFVAAMKKKDEELQDCREEMEELRYDMKKMNKSVKQKDQQGECLCSSIDCLREENRRLREELCMICGEVQKVQALECQLQALHDELCEKNCVIEQYDAQFQQLLGVVETVHGSKTSPDIVCLQDKDSQTHIEELAASTRATLDQISREIRSSQSLEADLAASKCQLECARREGKEKELKLKAQESENTALKTHLEKTKDVIRESLSNLNYDAATADHAASDPSKAKDLISHASDELKKSLSVAETKAHELQNKNDELSKALADCQNKVKAQENELSKMAEKAENLEKELVTSKADLDAVNKIVSDINSVKQRNDNLGTVLDAVDYKTDYETCKHEGEELKKKNAELEEQLKKCMAEKLAASEAARAANEAAARAASEAAARAASEEAARAALASQPGPADGAASAGQLDSAGKQGASDAPNDKKEKKSTAKIAQLQKIHEAQRSKYEKEIDGHRLSNKALQKSLNKMTNKMQNISAAEFECEFRQILDNFTDEICMWRNQKLNKKLTKLQEIGKKILELGIGCLTYKELVYLHQQVADAADKLRPQRHCKAGPSSVHQLVCCKCSGNICAVPMVPRENERILLEKLAILEQEINSARECLRKLKQKQSTCSVDSEQMELETIRAKVCSRNCGGGIKPSAKAMTFRTDVRTDEYELPTQDTCGHL